MAFHFHVSTDLEHLAERFRTEIYEKNSSVDILRPVTVTVQTQGMAIWLRQYIAKRSPVAMNLEMPFLRSSIRKILCGFEKDAESSFQNHSAEVEIWKIFDFLSREAGRGRFPELDFYLKDDPDLRKRYQISCEISSLFDQYRIYRPDMIESWRSGSSPDPEWQERIYRELFADEPSPDFYLNRFIERSKTYDGEVSDRIVSVFGISSMPPVFLHFFLALAKFQEVHFFYLSPASEYWADADIQCRTGFPEPELGEFSNPVLHSLGGQGREFFRELLRSGTWDLAEEDFGTEPEGTTLLGALQQDIREDRNRVSGERVKPDGSLLIENCHTPLREIEVLHDRILREMSKGRAPGDFLVAAPSIEKYVPCIESVFGTGPLAGCYSIADREMKEAGIIFPFFLKILKIPSSDYTFSEIFSLLENESVQKKFGLKPDSLPRLEAWCAGAGVRWGLDERSREEKCGIRFGEFSWENGIRRLLYGYAVQENFGEQLDFPELPFDFAEGAQAEELGGFLDFLKEIFLLREQLSPSGKMTPGQWFLELRNLPDRFFLVSDPAAVEERSRLIRNLTDLAESSGGCGTEVPFAVALEVLERMNFPCGPGAFLRGKITFCSMVPMRTIPMPVIAILGLNTGDFPRRDVLCGFNLIAENMKPTDRSSNLEDRYLLLEMILAARKKLLISYCGQSAMDNSEVFPPPPLSELILYLECLTGQTGNRRDFFIKHHIQAGDKSYFNGKNPNLFSYSREALEAAVASGKSEQREFPAFEPADLSQSALSALELPETVSIRELESFFRSPVEHYLLNARGITLRQYAENPPGDSETFRPGPLERHILKREIVEEKLKRTVPADRLEKLFRKKGELPPGSAGKNVFEENYAALKKILSDSFLRGYREQHEEIMELSIPYTCGKDGQTVRKTVKFTGGVRLSENREYSCRYHPGKFKEKHLNIPWLNHVFLSAAEKDFRKTICLFEDKCIVIKQLDKELAERLLLRFAAMRAAGTEKPVPFIHGAGLPNKDYGAYIKNIVKAAGEDRAASLFYKKEDFTKDFAKQVEKASHLVLDDMMYAAEVLKDEPF